MKRKVLLIIPLALLAATALIVQGESPAEVAGADSSDNPAANEAGMMLYIDPDTGELVEASKGQFPVELTYDDAFSTDDWGLVEESAPKGGGTMVDLQGRFMNTFTATADDAGNLSSSCDLHKHVDKTDSEKEGE
jgi:hypothetical protein